MDSFMEELLQTFHDESSEIFEGLDNNLLELEKSPDNPEIIQNIFRLMHTLKGSANMMGMINTGHLSHILEDLLDNIRAGKQTFNPELVNLFFDSVDILRACVRAELSGAPLPEGYPTMISVLSGEAQKKSTQQKTAEISDEPDEQLIRAIRDIRGQDSSFYSVILRFDEMCPMKSAAAMLAVESMRDRFDLLSVKPDHDAPEIEDVDFFTIILHTQAYGPNTIIEHAQVPGMIDTVEVNEFIPPDDIDNPPHHARTSEGSVNELKNSEGSTPEETPGQDTLRVNWEQLVDLMNYVEELFVGRAKFQQTLGDIIRENQQNPAIPSLMLTYRSMDKLIGRIQEKVLDIRRIPLETELGRMNRIVRDLSFREGKEVHLRLRCSNVEIDRGQWDLLAEVLIRVMTALIQFELNTSHARNTGEKTPPAIIIDARYSSTDVVVDVSTNPQPGGDLEFIPLEQLNEMLKTIRGRLEILKIKNSSLCRIRIPTNSSTVGVLLVRRNGRTYAIALSAIHEIIKFTPENMRTVGGKPIITYKGRAVPLRGIEEASPDTGNSVKTEESSLGIVLKEGDMESIVTVDEIIGENEILLKELKGESLQSSFIQGVTILGDGRVIIILNHRAFI